MQIKVNDRAVEVPESCTLEQVLLSGKLAKKPVAIILNQAVVHREQWGNHKLSPGDSLEIIRIIGGG